MTARLFESRQLHRLQLVKLRVAMREKRLEFFDRFVRNSADADAELGVDLDVEDFHGPGALQKAGPCPVGHPSRLKAERRGQAPL
jgi:hypothetical protein